MKSCAAMHGIISLILLLLLPYAMGQSPPSPDPYPYVKFSPSMAIIIVVLIAALFFMGFFSIYIRQCSDTRNGTGIVRPVTGRSRRAARGLDPAVIENLPTFPYSEVKELKIGKGALECAVCLMEFEDDETLRLIPKCDHVFHHDCIDAWLVSHTTCPVCRANLVPEPSESTPDLPESDSESDIEAQNDAVPAELDRDETLLVQKRPPEPELMNVNQTLNRNRTRGSRSGRPLKFPRSHSTGHSLVQPGENMDRFTLKLPADVRKQIMNRRLNRATSLLLLPREGSTRKGYRSGSSKGKNLARFDRLDSRAKSDRWVFSMAPPFLTRASSIRSQTMAANGEGPSRRLPEKEAPLAETSRPPV
ncbi:E3 ubiquitin-protein ligase ATL6-like [Tripterygium wilfordii]|uniref:RING-type E3 ubiquitin transferase n=1 Tax=Tripterygium wilfordii TaxID=458696 RepID=A0A7J7D2P7_TRIWF|nr:E3 ubiquitin-protein ligase ATL6 [Tripterygium wilfordii]KAF5740593.1 E3 ubiquitin-protein ligase ATL6-like [Tripterygium wilfordii]